MGDSETVKVVLRKSDLAPGLKNIDLKSLREILAKAQNKQQAASKLENVSTKKPSKEPVVIRKLSSPEKIFIKQEPVSPVGRKTPQRVVSIKPGTWTQPHAAPPLRRVSFGPEKIPPQYRKVHIVKSDKPEFSCCFCDFTSMDADKYRRHISSHVRNKSFRCTTCEFSTDSIAAYNRHMASHKKDPIGPLYGCSVCDFKALTPQALIKHKASLRHNKLKEKPTLKCKICSFTDGDVYKVAEHISMHDPAEEVDCKKCNHPGNAHQHNPLCPEVVNPLPFKCEDVIVRPRKRNLNCTLCEFQSDEILFLMEHIKAHSRSRSGTYDDTFDEELPFCCTMCDYRCVRPAKLVEHMKTHGPGAVAFCCKECNFESKDITVFKAHWKSHSVKAGAFKCFVCLRAFSCSADLSEHMIVHAKGKPFACNICEYQCLTKQKLLLHLKTHSRKKTQVFFPCPLCKNKYSTSVSLRQHLQTHSSDDKPFKCEYCDYSCFTSELLKVHLEKHTAEFKFRCKICQSAFSTEASLKSHVLDHVALTTPTVCSICNRTFPSRALLAKHQAAQHRGNAFSCEICHADFLDEKDYNTHMVEHEMAEEDANNSMEADQEEDQTASKNTVGPQEKFGYVEEQVYAGSETDEETGQEEQHQLLGYPMVTD